MVPSISTNIAVVVNDKESRSPSPPPPSPSPVRQSRGRFGTPPKTPDISTPDRVGVPHKRHSPQSASRRKERELLDRGGASQGNHHNASMSGGRRLSDAFAAHRTTPMRSGRKRRSVSTSPFGGYVCVSSKRILAMFASLVIIAAFVWSAVGTASVGPFSSSDGRAPFAAEEQRAVNRAGEVGGTNSAGKQRVRKKIPAPSIGDGAPNHLRRADRDPSASAGVRAEITKPTAPKRGEAVGGGKESVPTGHGGKSSYNDAAKPKTEATRDFPRIFAAGATMYAMNQSEPRASKGGRSATPFQSDMRQDQAAILAPSGFRNDTSFVQPQVAEWKSKCVPMTQWQRTFRPTCNSVHELDVARLSPEADASLLSAGGSWRMAWKVKPLSTFLLDGESEDEEARGEARASGSGFDDLNRIPGLDERQNSTAIDRSDDHASVLKMLRIDRPYTREVFDYHIVDSVAMERLTSSPFVVDEYGFCGNSVLTEYADGSARELLKRTDDEGMKPRERLILARNIARGLADIHAIDYADGTNATLVHNDINLANLARVHHSSIKFNDFNIGVMLRWNEERDGPCGFPVMFSSPLWRSPEEIRNETYVSEKIDVYSLGNVLFQILTKHQPWTWLEPGGRPTLEEVAAKKARGELPAVPEKYTNSTNMAQRALHVATLLAFTYDPEQRPSARRLADALSEVAVEFERWKRKERKKVTMRELRRIFMDE